MALLALAENSLRLGPADFKKSKTMQTTEKIKTHNLGYPRIGENRELKRATEAFWNGTITQAGNNFIIALTTSLTASTIVNSLDTNGVFDFAVHLQNCGPNSGTCQPGLIGSNSLVVGEVPTPEPSSLALFGTGILGVANIIRRRKANFNA